MDINLPGVTPPIPDEKVKVSLLSISDLDGRTNAAKTARAMRRDIIADLGGEDELSAIERALVDSVAISTAIIEDAQVRWLKGEPGVNLTEITTIANARRRDMQLLGVKRQMRDVTPSLDAYIASTYGKGKS